MKNKNGINKYCLCLVLDYICTGRSGDIQSINQGVLY